MSQKAKGKTDALAKRMAPFAKRLLVDFADEVLADPARFKRRAVSRLKILLPPYAGRPRSKKIDHAIKLRAEGLKWAAICSALDPNFATYSRDERQQEKERLRKAVARRQRGEKTAVLLPRSN